MTIKELIKELNDKTTNLDQDAIVLYNGLPFMICDIAVMEEDDIDREPFYKKGDTAILLDD